MAVEPRTGEERLQAEQRAAEHAQEAQAAEQARSGASKGRELFCFSMDLFVDVDVSENRGTPKLMV